MTSPLGFWEGEGFKGKYTDSQRRVSLPRRRKDLEQGVATYLYLSFLAAVQALHWASLPQGRAHVPGVVQDGGCRSICSLQGSLSRYLTEQTRWTQSCPGGFYVTMRQTKVTGKLFIDMNRH